MASRWLQISLLCYGSCRGHAARRGAATGPRACLPVTTAGDRAWDFTDGGIRVLGRPPSDPAVLRQTGSMGETAFYPFLSGLGQPVALSEGEGGPRSRCLAAPRAQRPSTPTHAQAGPSIRPTGRRSGKASSESEAHNAPGRRASIAANPQVSHSRPVLKPAGSAVGCGSGTA